MKVQTEPAKIQKILLKTSNHKVFKSKYMSLHKLIPNMITLTAMSCGMSSIKFAMAEKWELAVLALIVAGVIDAFDGAAARLLNAQSKLGAELDSLSDFLCFGIAPAFLLFLWTASDSKVAWVAALVFAMCAALRLARFNVSQEVADKNNPLHKYFTGVPAPMGAGLALMPMGLAFQANEASSSTLLGIIQNPSFVYCWMLVCAAMMVSRIPTFSTKQVKIHHKMIIPALGVFVLLLSGLVSETWFTLTSIGAAYLLLIPLGVRYHNKKAKDLVVGESDSQNADEADLDDADDDSDDE